MCTEMQREVSVGTSQRGSCLLGPSCERPGSQEGGKPEGHHPFPRLLLGSLCPELSSARRGRCTAEDDSEQAGRSHRHSPPLQGAPQKPPGSKAGLVSKRTFQGNQNGEGK